MELRATTVVEIVVPDRITQEVVLSRLGALPHGHDVRIDSPIDQGLTSDAIVMWHARSRPYRVEDAVVYVHRPKDLFFLLLADRDVIEAPQPKYLPCRHFQIHAPWDLHDADLTGFRAYR